MLTMQIGMVQATTDWLAHNNDMAPLHRFVDRDAFARFAGIGVGCQRFQATQTLKVFIGPDYTADTLGLQSGGGNLVKSDSEADESGDDVDAD